MKSTGGRPGGLFGRCHIVDNVEPILNAWSKKQLISRQRKRVGQTSAEKQLSHHGTLYGFRNLVANKEAKPRFWRERGSELHRGILLSLKKWTEQMLVAAECPRVISFRPR